jgi:hypothetical protein
MKYFVILLTVMVYGKTAIAQTPEDSVKAVINRMFAGMKNADTVQMKSCFSDNMILQTVARNKDGKDEVLSESVNDFLNSISQLPAGVADEQIIFETIKADGPLAMAWTPYKFYFKGKFSHCGIDAYMLVRINGAWKIQYLIDTRRKYDCE